MLNDTAILSLIGASGFAAFEVWTAYKARDDERRYRRVSFWIKRILMAAVAGEMAWLFVSPFGLPASKARLLAAAVGFFVDCLPHLLGQVLKLMMSLPAHLPSDPISPDVEVPKILNPPSDGARLENPPIPQASDDQTAEKHDDQPVHHN